MGKKKGKGPLARLGRRMRNAIALCSALAASRIIPLFPLEFLHLFADMAGTAVASAGGKKKERTLEHLALAFPEQDEAWRIKIMRQSYQAAGKLFLEALWLASWNPNRDDERVILDTPDEWERTLALAHERQKGLVIFGSHLGALEIPAVWVSSRLGMPLMAVAAKPKIEEMEGPMRAVRERAGMTLIYRGSAGSAALRHLVGHGTLVMLVDHNLKGPGVEVPFFGQPAHTLLAPARLALQSGAIANTFFCLRDGKGRFHLQCDEPMVLEPFARDNEERLRQEVRLTKEYTRRIEEKIRRYPGQYLWMHKRWEKQSTTLPSPPG